MAENEGLSFDDVNRAIYSAPIGLVPLLGKLIHAALHGNREEADNALTEIFTKRLYRTKV